MRLETKWRHQFQPDPSEQEEEQSLLNPSSGGPHSEIDYQDKAMDLERNSGISSAEG